jgi:hypothetical protein
VPKPTIGIVSPPDNGMEGCAESVIAEFPGEGFAAKIGAGTGEAQCALDLQPLSYRES